MVQDCAQAPALSPRKRLFQGRLTEFSGFFYPRFGGRRGKQFGRVNFKGFRYPFQ
jgi:hypothetical protein